MSLSMRWRPACVGRETGSGMCWEMGRHETWGCRVAQTDTVQAHRMLLQLRHHAGGGIDGANKHARALQQLPLDGGAQPSQRRSSSVHCVLYHPSQLSQRGAFVIGVLLFIQIQAFVQVGPQAIQAVLVVWHCGLSGLCLQRGRQRSIWWLDAGRLPQAFTGCDCTPQLPCQQRAGCLASWHPSQTTVCSPDHATAPHAPQAYLIQQRAQHVHHASHTLLSTGMSQAAHFQPLLDRPQLSKARQPGRLRGGGGAVITRSQGGCVLNRGTGFKAQHTERPLPATWVQHPP